MGFTFNMALYHYMIWAVIGLAILIGIATVAIAIYALFEKN